MEINILEGARGTGKSTLAFKLRQRTPETTLINFTGFHTDGAEGLKKISEYYLTWMKFFFSICKHDSKLVFDRFYFSESVYSNLYKNYDFLDTYIELNDKLEALSRQGCKINIFLLKVESEQELRQRLIRDKIPFGGAEESVVQTLRQQKAYTQLFKAFQYNYCNENLKFFEIDTSGKSNEDVYNEILQLKTAN